MAKPWTQWSFLWVSPTSSTTTGQWDSLRRPPHILCHIHHIFPYQPHKICWERLQERLGPQDFRRAKLRCPFWLTIIFFSLRFCSKCRQPADFLMRLTKNISEPRCLEYFFFLLDLVDGIGIQAVTGRIQAVHWHYTNRIQAVCMQYTTQAKSRQYSVSTQTENSVQAIHVLNTSMILSILSI